MTDVEIYAGKVGVEVVAFFLTLEAKEKFLELKRQLAVGLNTLALEYAIQAGLEKCLSQVGSYAAESVLIREDEAELDSPGRTSEESDLVRTIGSPQLSESASLASYDAARDYVQPISEHVESLSDGATVYTVEPFTMDFKPRSTTEEFQSCSQSQDENGVVSYTQPEESTRKNFRKRKYECPTCGKKVTNLKLHLLVHSGDKPYPCTICSQSFRQKVHLTNHHTSVHEDKVSSSTYRCSICSMTFKRQHFAISHVRRHSDDDVADVILVPCVQDDGVLVVTLSASVYQPLEASPFECNYLNDSSLCDVDPLINQLPAIS